jgi:SAM-dependent methyltransferase
MMKHDQYLLGQRRDEHERLQWQAELLAGEAGWLLDRLEIPRGGTVVEIGCGPRGCLDLLAERVGPDGRVIGVEPDEEAVAMARAFVDEGGYRNVEVVQADGRSSGLPPESFDLVTARLVLVNVPRPEEIVAEAVALTRPGGSVAFHEADIVSLVCDPPEQAWTRLREVIETYAHRNGIDVHVGRRLPRLLRAAGVIDIATNPLVYVDPPGHRRRAILQVFVDNLADRLVADGVITENELDELRGALTRHLDDPDTVAVSHLFVQACGRKPQAQRAGGTGRL